MVYLAPKLGLYSKPLCLIVFQVPETVCKSLLQPRVLLKTVGQAPEFILYSKPWCFTEFQLIERFLDPGSKFYTLVKNR